MALTSFPHEGQEYITQKIYSLIAEIKSATFEELYLRKIISIGGDGTMFNKRAMVKAKACL